MKTPSAGIEMSCASVESFHKKLTVPPGAIVTCAGLQMKTLELSTPTVGDRGLVFPVGGVEVAPGARVGGWVAAELDVAAEGWVAARVSGAVVGVPSSPLERPQSLTQGRQAPG